MSAPVGKFPVGLTVCALIAIALLVGLGAWQVRRLAWKERLLAQIAALQHAPARPLGAALARPDASFVRVEATCAPTPPATTPNLYRYAVRDGRIGWRLLSACKVGAGPYDGILLDRGLIESFMGATSPHAATFPPPGQVIGVLREVGAKPLLGPAVMEEGRGFVALRVVDKASLEAAAAVRGLQRPAPYLLAVEREQPAPSGLTPQALPADIPNNHLVYAMTWFALALIAAWFYGALMIRRRRP
jgi:surfeit locus 1 family protein